MYGETSAIRQLLRYWNRWKGKFESPNTSNMKILQAFIDLPSIFKDKTAELAIPNYFKNTETPIVCYKYNKPIRNTIFNYNKITSDLQIVENTPTSWDCSNSKFCYQPAGHVVTGDLNVIKDYRIRNLISKGPKYRIPSDIDFNTCRAEIAESLNSFLQ